MGRQRLKLIGWPSATSGGRHSLNSLQHRMGATQHYYCQILLFAFVMGINDDEELSWPRKSIKWTHKKYTSTFTYWHILHFRVMQETENNDPGGIIKQEWDHPQCLFWLVASLSCFLWGNNITVQSLSLICMQMPFCWLVDLVYVCSSSGHLLASKIFNT